MKHHISDQLDSELVERAFNRDERFAARFFGVDVETVRGWRKRGVGPSFRKVGGKLVRYSLVDLMAWVEKQPGGGQAA